MSLENIMNIAGMAMDAQTVRLNLSVSKYCQRRNVSFFTSGRRIQSKEACFQNSFRKRS